MAKTFSIKTTGIQKTTTRLVATKKLIEINIAKEMEKIGKDVKEEVKESIAGHKSEPRSVDTGEFLDSIISSSFKNSATISSNVPQSVFMEFGTMSIPERRHFRNSLDRKKKDIINILKNAIKVAT
ncbi:hypothetical protein KAI04_03795 [Candidatus Pacearchaeota archaeon]|nr:hypothetical protein [Candidatus Pacearchaeota archaeon]